MMNYAASLSLLGDKVVITNAKDEFELTSVEPGSLHVQTFHRDYLSASSEMLTLGQSTPLEGVRVSLSQGGGIYGKVNDRHGQLVSGSIVAAMSPQAFAGEGDTSAGGLSLRRTTSELRGATHPAS